MSEPHEQSRAAPGQSQAPETRGRVLVVDDEISIRIIAREILEGIGFQVEEAVDGQEGLDLFLAHRTEFDLVILDLIMPRLHGFQVMDGIRQVAPHMPILISSGYSPDERPELLTASRYLGFLPKPYRTRDLKEHVARLLNPAAQ